MKLRVAMIALACSGCGPTAQVVDPGESHYPPASERLLDKGACPDADGDGEGLLHDPVDGSAGALLEARKRNGRLYAECREAAYGLIEHERERLRWIRERAMREDQ